MSQLSLIRITIERNTFLRDLNGFGSENKFVELQLFLRLCKKKNVCEICCRLISKNSNLYIYICVYILVSKSFHRVKNFETSLGEGGINR